MQTSRELQGQDKFCPFVELNSDAAIVVKMEDDELMLAVEFEASQKSIKRYEAKLSGYYRYQNVEGVLYICVTSQILDMILKVDGKVSKKKYFCDGKVYAALLGNVLCGSSSITFKNTDGYVFDL